MTLCRRRRSAWVGGRGVVGWRLAKRGGSQCVRRGWRGWPRRRPWLGLQGEVCDLGGRFPFVGGETGVEG